MGLRTGIRSSVEGGTDSAMEASEWPQTITTEQSTFLVQLNLIRSSKISRTDAEKSSKSFVITKIWVRPNWSQSEIFSESCLLSNPKLLRRGNRSWLLLFLLLFLQNFTEQDDVDGGDSGAAMKEEACERLKKSYVYFKGKPVGTFAAMDPNAEALNYNQAYIYLSINNFLFYKWFLVKALKSCFMIY